MGKKRWSVASIFSVLAKVPLVGDKVLQGDQAQQSIIQMSRVRARLFNSNVRIHVFKKIEISF